MRYYHPFELSGYSFAERLGAPDPISAAIGQIMLQFAALEAHLTATLIHLLEGDESWTPLLAAGLSFAEKLQLLHERVRLLAPTRAFNTGTIDPLELFAELRTQCAQAAQLRAQVLDPAGAQVRLIYIGRWRRHRSQGRHQQADNRMGVHPGAGQARPGPTVTGRLMDPGELLDVADFLCMVIRDFEESFLPDRLIAPSHGMGLEGLG
jgi:hypothetical protein